jgi:type I restriction enzyme S subunit
MVSELPAGWVSASIGEICSQGEQRIPEADEQFTYIDIASVDRGRKTVMEPQLLRGSEAPSRARKVVATGDVIVSMTRPNLNAIALIGQRHDSAIASTGFDVLRPIEVDPRWIFAAVKSTHFVKAMSAKVQGALYPAIKADDIRKHEIPLPPLAEQKRIAQKLDALLAQVDTLKARIDAIPALLKRFRESALSAAVSGRITQSREKSRPPAEPRRLNDRAQPASAEEISQAIEVTGEPFPDQWTVYALEQIVDGERGIPYGIVQTGDPVVEGVPTVRCGDVRHLRIDTTALKIVARDIEKNYARTRLKGGEVLLAIRGSVGNTAVAPKSLANCNISREVAMIPCIDDVDSTFVALVLQSKRGQQLLAGKTRGVAQKGINLADVRRLLIALPSRSAQSEIVRRVEQFFAYADQLEAKVAAAQQRIDALTQSLLAKAFRGELVPQDPTDEPASVLLGRIRAQRAATPKPKRGRKAATS